MKKFKSLKALVLSLMLCLAMGTTAFASEATITAQAAPNANKEVEVNDCGDLVVTPASVNDDAVALADTVQYDANRTITRSNSRSGVFNGNYTYTINNSSVTKLCLLVYMPNESGTDYL